MNPTEAQALPQLYLIKNLREQLEKGLVAWELIAQFLESEDPILNFRSKIYSVSFDRRSKETRI